MPNYMDSSLETRAKDELGVKPSQTLQPSAPEKSTSVFGTLENPFKLGQRGSGTRPLGTLQDYNVLRKTCLEKDTLFEDTEFPATLSSIYGSQRIEKNIKWLRPSGIVPNPQLFVDGASRFDIKQGNFGDCWLLAATADLATHENLLHQVIPQDQSFREGQYAGIFHFRFWQYGKWVDVVIDDRLPTFKGKLLGLYSATTNEFWSALLEKAYAKLHGSYTALEGGDTGDALEDFTGGVAELYTGDSVPSDLFDVLLKAYEKNSLMGCSFKQAVKAKEENNSGDGNNETEEKEGDEKVNEDAEEQEEVDTDDEEDRLQGLIERHAYSITQVKYVSKSKDSDEKISLLRVRNPWGTEDEWLGAWSDKSAEWESISDETKKELGVKSADDGEFWICFQDFKDHLSDLEICYLNLNSVSEIPEEKEWEISSYHGEWVSGVTAGGSYNHLELFQHNPQYLLTLKEECTVIIAVMQKNRRIQGRASVNFLNIGFQIIPLEADSSKKIPKPLNYKFLDEVDAVDIDYCKKKSAPESSQYSAHRQVSCRVKLVPGSYCVIPSTYDVEEDGEFLLRVFSEKPHQIEEYHEQISIDEPKIQKMNESGNDRFQEYFRLLSGDDWEIDWIEQKKVIDFMMSSDLHTEGISKSACRGMVAMLDVDRSGKLNFNEYKEFWQSINKLKNVFNQMTTSTDDDVGYLSTYDLRKALNKAGYHVNIHVLGRLVRRYGTEDHKIVLEDFMMLGLRIKTLMDTFRDRDPLKKNIATFTLDEWFDNTLYF